MSPWAASHRRALARALLVEVDRSQQQQQRQQAEQVACAIDGGIGQLSAAAIAAMPRGPARDMEIARWVRRVRELGVDQVAFVQLPGAGPEQLEAHVELLDALWAEAA